MNSLRKSLVSFLESTKQIFELPQCSPALNIAPHFGAPEAGSQPAKGFLDDLKDGILQAVQTSRRSVERRQWRRIGMPQFQCKPRQDLKCCIRCGHYHEAHTLCGHCYSKIKAEADIVMKAMTESYGYLKPIERDIVVKYEDDVTPETETRKIVEIPKKRPSVFCKNLLEKENKV